MIMTPSSLMGANTAERAPRAILALPSRSRFHSSYLSAAFSPECSTATSSPNLARNMPSICGVSEISGTSMIAPRPAASVRAMTERYTSVLPLPVTPCRRYAPGRDMTASAAAC